MQSGARRRRTQHLSSSSSLPSENHVLRACGKASEPGFERPQRRQDARKEEEKVRLEHVEPRAGQQFARGGEMSFASRSNGMRRITRRVPGFQGLFSQKPKTPPSASERCI